MKGLLELKAGTNVTGDVNGDVNGEVYIICPTLEQISMKSSRTTGECLSCLQPH